MARRIAERRRQSAQRNVATAEPKDAVPDHSGEVGRIDGLTRAARAAWLSLLFALTFAAITLVGVRDIDFFVPERQTELPLFGVSVPTYLVFALGPSLCFALYANLHFHLMKLWEAASKAPARVDRHPLSDALSASFISDLALSQRHDRALRPRPLRKMTNVLTFILVVLACPIVLAAIWWRSATAHHELLTLVACGIPLLASILVGATSWARLRRLTGKATLSAARARQGLHVDFCILTFLVTFLGWMRTEGTLDRYAHDWLGLPWEEIDAVPWSGFWFPELIASIDLQDSELVALPDDWLPRERAKQIHRVRWCRDAGLPMDICPNSESPDEPTASLIASWRQEWCERNMPEAEASLASNCAAYFAALPTRLEMDWKDHRDLALSNLPTRDLRFYDLSFANLLGARLEGANLSRARLDEETSFTPVTLRGAGVKDVDLSHTSIARLSEAFGDTTVALPDGFTAGEGPLSHWSREPLDWLDFQKAWRKWQAEHHPDLLPDWYTPDWYTPDWYTPD